MKSIIQAERIGKLFWGIVAARCTKKKKNSRIVIEADNRSSKCGLASGMHDL